MSRWATTKINKTSVTKFLGIHLDNTLNFVNHISEMSIKVANSIGILYKLKFPSWNYSENVIYFVYSSILIRYRSIHGMEHQNYTSKILILQKKAIRTINNLAYNEHTNARFNFFSSLDPNIKTNIMCDVKINLLDYSTSPPVENLFDDISQLLTCNYPPNSCDTNQLHFNW